MRWPGCSKVVTSLISGRVSRCWPKNWWVIAIPWTGLGFLHESTPCFPVTGSVRVTHRCKRQPTQPCNSTVHFERGYSQFLQAAQMPSSRCGQIAQHDHDRLALKGGRHDFKRCHAFITIRGGGAGPGARSGEAAGCSGPGKTSRPALATDTSPTAIDRSRAAAGARTRSSAAAKRAPQVAMEPMGTWRRMRAGCPHAIKQAGSPRPSQA